MNRFTAIKMSGVLLAIVGLLLSSATPANATTAKPGQRCSALGQKAPGPYGTYKCMQTTGRIAWVLFSTRSLPAFEVRYTRQVAQRVVRDLGEADCRSRDGIMVGSALDMLADDFANLASNAEYPPGVVRSKYYARAITLSDFASDGADAYYYDDEMTGYVKLQVILKETPPLFAMINTSLGTDFKFIRLAKC